MKRSIKAWALTFAFVVGLTGSVYAQVSVLPPDQDPWYTPPAGYESLPNGGFIRDRQINAMYLAPLYSTDVLTWLGTEAQKFAPYITILQNLKINAYQVLYKSVDSHNQPTTGVATILVPQGPWQGNGTRPLISYGVEEDSPYIRCAPSYQARTGLLNGQLAASQFAIALALPALAYGYALVVPDYEGPQSQWIAGPQAGHSTLDAIRATLAYAPAGLNAGTQVGIMGYSGGGSSSGWATALAASYAPELNIVGATIGAGSNNDVAQMYTNNDGKITDGLIVMAINGLARAFPESGINDYMNVFGKALVASASTSCTIDGVIKYAFAGPLENYTIAPWVPVPQSAPGKYIFGINSLVNQGYSPNFPVLIYNDSFDELVPPKASNDLAKQWCAAGANVQIMRTATPTPFVALVHVAGAIEGVLPAYNFLTNRFNGAASRNDCSNQSAWSTDLSLFLKLPYHPFDTQ